MKKVIGIVAAAFLVGCTSVGPTERGVKLSFGRPVEVVAPGFYFVFPGVRSFTTYSIAIGKTQIDTTAASKDMQTLSATASVNWSVKPEAVMNLFTTIGNTDTVGSVIIEPALHEVFKAATAQYSAEDILTRREELKKVIDDQLKARMAQYAGVEVTGVNIVNFQFSKDFMESVENKQIAEQKAKQAEFDAQRAIKEADAEVNRARGRSTANAMMAKTITPEVLQQQALEKWNGVLPSVTTGAVPFIKVDGAK